MARNIVIFSDGTGNTRGDGSPTNVERLFDFCLNGLPDPLPDDAALRRLLDRDSPDHDGFQQLCFYNAGVGAELGDLIGRLIGRGISRNIRDCYEFLVKVYQPGDRIFLFGFSRGAYTVRSLAGLIGLTGIANRMFREDDGGTQDLLLDPDRRKKIVRKAYDVYKTGYGEGRAGKDRRSAAGRAFRERYSYAEHLPGGKSCAVYFIGVWDTVRSLGLALGIGDIELTIHPHRFHNHDLSDHVPFAFHGLSVDDNRYPFHPTIWNEPRGYPAQLARNGQTFEQIWFPGMHSDVGGGVDDRRLSDIALQWMIDKSQVPPLPILFDGGVKPVLTGDAVEGRFYNVYKSIWARLFYRKADRTVAKGIQRPTSKKIKRTGDADLTDAWRDRMKVLFDHDYNPRHMRDHPEFPD